MSYPIYKLLRAVNRQYPNNGFIHDVDVREEMTNGIIEEDLRDLINETIQEVYKDVAIDEVWSFPTVPGQNQYSLPEDCDLRDIQEVTRTFAGSRLPLKPPPRPGPEPTIQYEVMFKVDVNKGNMGTLPGGNVVTELGKSVDFGERIGNAFNESEIQVFPNEGYSFTGWSIDGTTVIPLEEIFDTIATEDITYIGVFKNEEEDEMRKLIDDLTLTNGVLPDLEEGFYYTGSHKVFVSGGVLPLFGQYSTFYYDVETKTLTGPFTSATYDTDSEEWLLARDEMLATEVTNNDRIPVNSATYTYGDKKYITVTRTSAYELTTNNEELLPFNATLIQNGHLFDLSSGMITVNSSGRDVVAKVNLNLRIPSSSASQNPEWTVAIYVNSSAVFTTTIDLIIPSAGTHYGQILATPFYTYLMDGDVISVKVTNSQGAEISGGYLTIEEA